MIRTYEGKGHTIHHGDALEVLGTAIPAHSVDLIFADPPYNIGKKFSHFDDRWPTDADYVQWACQWIDLCLHALKPEGTLYLMASTQSMPSLDMYLREKISVLSRIVWFYDSSGVQAKKYFGSLYEPILHCVKNPQAYCFNADDILVEARTGAERQLVDYRGDAPRPYNTRKIPGNVWEFPRVRYRMAEYEEHPTQKPEALLERVVRASSRVGDVVLDPFAGSFTTAAVCDRLGRRSVSIESQEQYVKIGLRRVLNWTEHEGQPLAQAEKNTSPRRQRAGGDGAKAKGVTTVTGTTGATGAPESAVSRPHP